MTCIKIIQERDDWLLVYKPEGISFHSESGEPGLVEILREQLSTRDIWPVHRLDKPTSGIILFAKNAEAAAELSKLFAERKVEKYYLAVTSRKPNKKQGWIIGDMEKSRRGAYKLTKSKNNPAVTQFISVAAGEGQRLCLLKPHTGKTHQLRVALKALSAPILGDVMYGGAISDRLYLHAYAITFEFGGERFCHAEPPENIGAYSRSTVLDSIHEWSNPWSIEWPKPAKF